MTDERFEADDPALDDGQVVEPWDDPRFADDNSPSSTPVLDRGTSSTGTSGGSGQSDVSVTPVRVAFVDRADEQQFRMHAEAEGIDVADAPPAMVLDSLQQKAITDCAQHLYTNISGTAGCLCGATTIVHANRGTRPGGRSYTLADFYLKFNGLPSSRSWDTTIPTYLHSLGDDGVMFYNRVIAVYESGEKDTVQLAFEDNQQGLRATPDHPVMTPDGFVAAGSLRPGAVVLRRGTMLAQSSGGRDWSERPPRVIVNVKYHPYGSKKIIAYRNVGGAADSPTTYEYMRVHRARLVVEAELNNLPYAEYVHALKHNAALSATFRYIPPEFEVHHDDENTLNDDIQNLMVLSKAEHARLHNQKENFRFDSYTEVAVAAVSNGGKVMTYDVQMEAPANNFCANGIVVHNTGKTFVAKEIVKRQPGTLLCATTGIASVNLGEGTTINAALRYFNTDSLKDSYTNGHLQSVIRKLRRAGVTRLLIDEKSMMPGAQLTYITRAVREVNEGGIYALESVGAGEDGDDYGDARSQRDLPPIGITLVGDFGQLPPVPDEDPKTGKKLPVQFAFDSPEWPAFAEHTTRLETIYRQDAKDFVAALHAVRRGDVSTALSFFTAARFSDTMADDFVGSTIFAKNDSVDRHNLLMLDRLPGKAVVAQAIRKGKQRGDWKLIPDELRLKEGALVMILANRREYEDDDDDRGRLIYVNGDLGDLVGVQGVAWLVRLQRTGGVVRVLPVRRENTIPLEPGRRKELVAMLRAGQISSIDEVITEKGKGRSEIIGTLDYMPLRAAYGCTVHKTQGLTLTSVQVNLRDPFFRQPGMLFVALSRCQTAGGLRIVGDQRGFVERIKIEPRVQPWL